MDLHWIERIWDWLKEEGNAKTIGICLTAIILPTIGYFKYKSNKKNQIGYAGDFGRVDNKIHTFSSPSANQSGKSGYGGVVNNEYIEKK